MPGYGLGGRDGIPLPMGLVWGHISTFPGNVLGKKSPCFSHAGISSAKSPKN